MGSFLISSTLCSLVRGNVLKEVKISNSDNFISGLVDNITLTLGYFMVSLFISSKITSFFVLVT